MNLLGKLLLWLFWSGLLVLWIRYTFRTYYLYLLLSEFYSETNQTNIIQTGIGASLELCGSQILLQKNKCLMRAIIKFSSNLGEVFPQNLSKQSFLLTERYEGKDTSANISDVSIGSVQVMAILLLDNSDSMEEDSGIHNYSKMFVAQEAVCFFIDTLTQHSENYVAILPFSGDDCTIKDFLTVNSDTIWSNRRAKVVLKKLVRGLSPNDATPLWSAVNLALDQLYKVDRNCYKVIVILSDGLDSNSIHIDRRLIEKVSEMDVPIFTLCYGADQRRNVQDLAILSESSGAGGEQVGSFADIHPRDLPVKLGGIGQGLANVYEIRWRQTGAPSKTEVEVVCNVNYNINKKAYKAEILQTYIAP